MAVMMAARFSKVPLTAFVSTIGRQTLKPTLQGNVTRLQMYASEPSRHALRRGKMAKQGRTMKEKIMAPGGESAITLGQGMLAGASATGLAMLCYYGAGLSSKAGYLEHSVMWPEYVKSRVKTTYMYFAGGIGFTAVTAIAASRSPTIMRLATKNSMLAIGATFALMIGTGSVARSIPYQKGFGAKQLAWLVHAGVLGCVIAPITMLGGPVLVRAAWYTTGVVGGLSALAMTAPSEKFLNMGAPLACGFGVILVSSLAGPFLPAGSALGTGLYAISVYGGLVLFGAFLLYDTQKIMRKAEGTPNPYGQMDMFDPVNASLGIYADTLNIFIRIAMLLAAGKRK